VLVWPPQGVTDPVRIRHQLGVKPITAGKLAAGVAGTAGAGSMGALVEALIRITALHTVSAAAWVMMATLIVVPALMASLALIMGYRLRKLEIESGAGLAKARQEMYRVLLEKSAASAASSADHQKLINTDTQHLLAERNATRLNRRTDGHLCSLEPPEAVQ
jgi:hypothetical protein